MDTWLGILLIIIFCIVGAAISFTVTYFVLKGKIEEAKKSADDNSKALTEQLNSKIKEADDRLLDAEKRVTEANLKIEEAARKGEEANEKVESANKRAEEIINNATIQAKNLTIELKNQADQEMKEKRQELQAQENKLSQREANIDRRDQTLLERENALEQKNAEYQKKAEDLSFKEQEVANKEASIDAKLLEVANLSNQEARQIVLDKVESKMSVEIANMVKQMEDEAKENCDKKAKDLLALAMSKYSQEVVSERTVSVVELPSDEMKGRIIGREGRNIRTLEQLLGTDIIIDDTPEVIQVSCFDPIRREKARLALDYLIKDGRIQPGRIEEVVEKASQEVDQSCHEAGINAAFKLGLPRINKDLLDYVGRLKYRTSYTQNALDHSMQVAYLAGIMAAELGLNQNIAKRAGLLHDIGKAADFELDGSHVEIGVRLAKKYGEPDIVINAIASHHGDCEPTSIYSVIVQAADTLSAARPGARNESLENYIQRIEGLENIAKSFDGVAQAYAMQSGREIRIMVEPEKIDDAEITKLAYQIKNKVENEMTYPGQIKISVIRETRATEICK